LGRHGRRNFRAVGRWALAAQALLIAALACSAPRAQPSGTPPPGAPETSLAGTLSAVIAQTALAAPATATASATSTPEPSSTPTITQTETPEGVFAALTANTHCRTGPLSIYDLIATVLTGQQVRITGRNSAGDYWYVTAPNGRDCWMWGRYAQVSGETSQIPVFTPPPTPTPTFVWAGDWTVWIGEIMGSMSLVQSGSNVSGTLTSPDASFTLTGTTSNAGRDLSGEVFDDGMENVADFAFHMLDNTDQFRGSYTDPEAGVWCGARDGAEKPSPCGWP
jgi:hypothetical protein